MSYLCSKERKEEIAFGTRVLAVKNLQKLTKIPSTFVEMFICLSNFLRISKAVTTPFALKNSTHVLGQSSEHFSLSNFTNLEKKWQVLEKDEFCKFFFLKTHLSNSKEHWAWISGCKSNSHGDDAWWSWLKSSSYLDMFQKIII